MSPGFTPLWSHGDGSSMCKPPETMLRFTIYAVTEGHESVTGPDTLKVSAMSSPMLPPKTVLLEAMLMPKGMGEAGPVR